MSATWRRGIVATVLLCGVWLSFSSPVAADDAPSGVPVTAPRIIPQPNSGTPPKQAGDLGSGTQFLVFAGIVVAGGVIVLLVRRESQRNIAKRQQRSSGEPESADAG